MRLGRILEFFIIGVIAGTIEDLIAVYLVTGEISFKILGIVVIVAIPFAIIEKYASLKKPGQGVKWKANFYKCGDKTSHPHWLTWSVVENPKPNFHLPQYFGTLQFD